MVNWWLLTKYLQYDYWLINFFFFFEVLNTMLPLYNVSITFNLLLVFLMNMELTYLKILSICSFNFLGIVFMHLNKKLNEDKFGAWVFR